MSLMRTALLCASLAGLPVLAQTIGPAQKADAPDASSAPTNQLAYLQAAETIRSNCIQGRRIICGRIVKVLPGGLVVDSGYTSLMRHPLDRSWLIPSTVEAEREPNLVEKNEPDCVCVGLVFLTDIPKSRRAKPKVLDYVVLSVFPTGNFTYNSVGTIQRTVRRFSNSLPIAVRLNCEAAGIHPPFMTLPPATNSPIR
jgi:hypothetical protein